MSIASASAARSAIGTRRPPPAAIAGSATLLLLIQRSVAGAGIAVSSSTGKLEHESVAFLEIERLLALDRLAVEEDPLRAPVLAALPSNRREVEALREEDDVRPLRAHHLHADALPRTAAVPAAPARLRQQRLFVDPDRQQPLQHLDRRVGNVGREAQGRESVLVRPRALSAAEE